MLLPETHAFIFDMDGVLIDSENRYKVLERELFDEIGLNMRINPHIYQNAG